MAGTPVSPDALSLCSLRIVLCALAALGSLACGSRIDSLNPARGAPGEEFTIDGTGLENLGGPPPVAPRMKR